MSISCIGNVFRFLLTGLCLLAIPSCGPSLPVLVSSTPAQVSIEFEPKKGVRSTSELAEEACAKEGKRAHYVATDGNIVKYDCVGLSLPAMVSATQERVAVEFDPTVGVHSTRALAEAACADVGRPAQFSSTEGSIAFYDCLETAVPERKVTPSSPTRGIDNNLYAIAFWPGEKGGLQSLVFPRSGGIHGRPVREVDNLINGNYVVGSISMNDDGIIVSALRRLNDRYPTDPDGEKLVHHVGQVTKNQEGNWVIGWGPRLTLGIESSYASIALASAGNEDVVVLVTEGGAKLYYRVGDLKREKLQSTTGTCVGENGDWRKECFYYGIVWRGSPTKNYDNLARRPSVALMNTHYVVEVHESVSLSKLYYNVGEIVGKEIYWRASGSDRNYTKGAWPSIAVTPDGYVIEVHKSQTKSKLFYNTGRINTTNKSIEWIGKFREFINNAERPSVTVKKDGSVMVAYLDTKDKTLKYRSGQVASGWSYVNWAGLQTNGIPAKGRVFVTSGPGR